MELLCQLWTINEQITELRKKWDSVNANNGDDDGDDMLPKVGGVTRCGSEESAIQEVEEMEEEERAVFEDEEEFLMRNGGKLLGSFCFIVSPSARPILSDLYLPKQNLANSVTTKPKSKYLTG